MACELLFGPEVRKAASVDTARCGCGRIAIVLKGEDGEGFASFELDPQEWLKLTAWLQVANLELIAQRATFDAGHVQ